jgi:hypothetical protein
MLAEFLILIGLMALLGVILSWQCWRSWRADRADSILIIVIYANFVWSLCPAIVAAVTGEFEVFTFGYPLGVWSRGLLLDVVFFVVFILTLKRIGRPPIFEKWAARLRSTPSPVGFLTWILFLAGALYLLMVGPWTGVGYEGAGRYIQDNLSSADITVGGVQLTIYRCVLVPALSVLLFYVARSRAPRWLSGLGWAVLTYVVADSIASGARGKVLEVFFAMAVCMLVAGHRKKALVYLVGSAAFLFLFSAAFLTFRGNAEQYAGESALTKSESVFQTWSQDTPKFEATLWLTTFLIRLDSVQNAGILADQTAESGNFATYHPFVGSFLAWMPRYFWPQKPLPLSIDATVAGLPWYLVMSYRDEPWNNGSVSVAGIGYWQFGWLGVVVTAIAGAAIFRALSTIGVRGGIVGLYLLVVFCMMTHFRIPVGLDEVLLVLFQLVIPLLILRAIYIRFVSRPNLRQPAVMTS